ncbi:MAG TPA: HAD family hydrolase [bacterium]|nr:HAD family hydrolase [bacterium]
MTAPARRPEDHPLLQAPLLRPFRLSPECASTPSGTGGAPAVFIDRDGVLNRLVATGYVRHPDELVLIPEALEGIRRLAQETDYRIILLTNQSVVGRGDIPRRMLERIHGKLIAEVEAAGGRFDLLQVCPHAPWMGCSCRKPRPGMLFDAAQLLGLDLGRSWTLGDSVRDILAGQAAGTKVGFIRYRQWHHEREWDRLVDEKHVVEFVAEDLGEAVGRLLELESTAPLAPLLR